MIFLKMRCIPLALWKDADPEYLKLKMPKRDWLDFSK